MWGCSGCGDVRDVGMFGMWDVGMFGMWDVGMFGMWGCGMWGCSGCGDVGCGDVRDVGMWDVGMFGMWGCGMWGCSGCGDVGCEMLAGMWDVDLQNAHRITRKIFRMANLKHFLLTLRLIQRRVFSHVFAKFK